jgi:hypothetical protein
VYGGGGFGEEGERGVARHVKSDAAQKDKEVFVVTVAQNDFINDGTVAKTIERKDFTPNIFSPFLLQNDSSPKL